MSNYKRNYRRLIVWAFKKRTLPALLAIFSILSAISVILLMYSLSVAVDRVFLKKEPFHLHDPLFILFVIALFSRGIWFWASKVVSKEIASLVKESLRNQLFNNVQNSTSPGLHSKNSGQLVSIAVEGVEKLDAFYSRLIPAAIHMILFPLTLAVFIFWMDWLSGLILIITAPLIPLFMSLIGRRAKEETKKQWKALQYLGSHFLDAIQGLRTLKLFNQQYKKEAEVKKNSNRFRTTTMGILKIAFLSALLLELFASIATAIVAVEIGIRLIEGYMVFQTGLFILLLTPEYYLPFRAFAAQHHAGMESTEAAGDIFEELEREHSRVMTPMADPLSFLQALKMASLRKTEHKVTSEGDVSDGKKENIKSFLFKAIPATPFKIEGKELLFRYPSNSTPTIEGCSFTLHPESITALIGKSGSGKTTIVRLLTRQLSPDSGEITVNAHPLNDIEEKEWLQKIAIVNQQAWFFDDTLLANLKAANPGARFDDIVRAAKRAEAHDFIQALPNQYLYRPGEGGRQLSGGERQRLSMARAFLRDAPFIILDEPSSALDPESESKINQALKKLFKNRTVLIIAHRFSTIRQSDHILLLDGGKIAAQGCHETLLETSNLYQKMAKSPFGE